MHDGILYYAMEYLVGGSLAQPAQPVDAALQVRAVGDAARALAALHRAGIVHGAVKPGNVLLDPYGAKLSDPDLNHVVAPGLRHSGYASTDGLGLCRPGGAARRTADGRARRLVDRRAGALGRHREPRPRRPGEQDGIAALRQLVSEPAAAVTDPGRPAA